MHPIDNSDAIINRLKRIEGQVKGIQKMVNEGKTCPEILTQVSAARAALNKVGGLIIECNIRKGIASCKTGDGNDEMMNELIDTVIKYTK